MRNTILAVVISLAVGLVGGWWFTTHRRAGSIVELEQQVGAWKTDYETWLEERAELEAFIATLDDSIGTLKAEQTEVEETITRADPVRVAAGATIEEHLDAVGDTAGLRLYGEFAVAVENGLTARDLLIASLRTEVSVWFVKDSLNAIIKVEQDTLLVRAQRGLTDALDEAKLWEAKANPPLAIRIIKKAAPVATFVTGVMLGRASKK